ncbi:dihydroneopterin aldolase [Candidatus Kapabacteria bacterium]|nr:dihydroneopterin aldolase [Candidatus Kapabacteria bacterium]
MKNFSPATIVINSAEFYAYHGVKQQEKQLGGIYQVDLELTYDAKEAAIEDNVNLAINYEEAIFVVSEIITGESCDLIETLAYEILNSLFDKFDALDSATIRVRKKNVPMRRIVESVEVEQTLTRGQISSE